MKLLMSCLMGILIAVPLAPIAVAAPTEAPPTTTPPIARPDAGTRPPIGTRGIYGSVYVGESAPGFELENASGRRVKLSDFAGERVMLCFADRRAMLSAYRGTADTLLAIGIRLVGVTRDSPRSIRALAERDSLSFEILSDPTGEISATYGSYDYATASIRPAYFLVGRTRIVRMALLGQRLPPDDLVRITRYALTGL